jgi:hypothetical protein
MSDELENALRRGVYVDWQGRFWVRVQGTLADWHEHTGATVHELREMVKDGRLMPHGFGARRKLQRLGAHR